MPHSEATINRGPAAAAENRRAILAAARTVFAERGYHAPLSAVAKAAGVGQGVLYRHFPTRLQLAFAVFDEHWAAYEALAEDPEPSAFGRLWRLVVDRTIENVAFVEMVLDARRTETEYDGAERMRALIGPPLERAVAAGLVDPALTVDDVMLAQQMVYGVVVCSPDPAGLRERVARALSTGGLLPPLT
ncbi:TetR/AcrR family transcriptional regulator [Nocardioides sp. GY 10113]|uniref:TetR/AcrR family transcriptional regulator n=1 Tax=Nocardioides sp. GY 10113 TaxID=2569761 RepID=UPI0010A91A5D|nr:TetR/AcrR family transcriptional regulator [Nocardioides sp. GY 10113]TIC83245.1 TetR/AcrR family transcriptional regulator [Nocardioides sp. GY 10113]